MNHSQKKRVKIVVAVAVFILAGLFLNGRQAKAASPYLIKINKQRCVVTIYKADEDGEYTKPYKAFLCSPGNATPIGIFRLKEKIRWHELMGPSYGQYCSRIVGGVLFHSVWYYKPNPATLSLKQYNYLGARVSHGCVRLCVRDAKWIYDNCPSGTQVVIYNSSKATPLKMPSSVKVSGYMGYDPTDIWSKNNPYNKKKPSIKGAKNGSITYAADFSLKKGITVKSSLGKNAKKYLTTTIYYKLNSSDKYCKVKTVNTKKPGFYKITYKLIDEIGHKAQVTICKTLSPKAAITKIKLNHSKRTLYLGGEDAESQTTLSVTKILPKKASIQKLKISSSDRSIATVTKNGLVKAKAVGECYITFMAMDGSGIKAKCKIVVQQKQPVFTLEATNEKVSVGTVVQVTPVFATTAKPTLNYTSSDESIATVDATGVVMGIAPGTVTITGTTTDGTNISASIVLTVINTIS